MAGPSIRKCIGPENFCFTYSGSKFLCLNTNSNERGYDGTIPDMPWLQKELSDLSTFRHAFVIAHMAPFHGEFDRRMEPAYASLMSSDPKIRLSLHGHQHSFEIARPYGDGFTYVAVGTIGKRNYALITVYSEGVTIQEVYYKAGDGLSQALVLGLATPIAIMREWEVSKSGFRQGCRMYGGGR